MNRTTSAIIARSHKTVISLIRQYLTYCNEHIQLTGSLGDMLQGLSSSLTDDGQFQEALGVADRCLEVSPRDLGCGSSKVRALLSLGKHRDARNVIDQFVRIGALTTRDVSAKNLILALRSELETKTPPADTMNVPSQTAPPLIPEGVSGSVKCWGTSVTLRGTIQGIMSPTSVVDLTRLFEQYHELQKAVSTGTPCATSGPEIRDPVPRVIINSSGGNVNSAMAIGQMLRKERASLRVSGVCFSACVLTLAGAVERQVGKSSKVGIHRPYFDTPSDKQPNADQVRRAYLQMLAGLRGYLRDMNVTERLADEMLAVEPENNRILSKEELMLFSLIGIDPTEQQTRAVAKEVADIEESGRLNMARKEYMRRKSIISTECSRGPRYRNCYDEVLKTGVKPALDFSDFEEAR